MFICSTKCVCSVRSSATCATCCSSNDVSSPFEFPFFLSFGLFRIWSTHWHPPGRGVSEERGQSRITKLNLACLLLLLFLSWWLLFDFLIGRVQMLVLPVGKSNKNKRSQIHFCLFLYEFTLLKIHYSTPSVSQCLHDESQHPSSVA